jgi:hypothetical protein
MNEEDIAQQLEDVLNHLGAFSVRRLANYILLDVPAEGDQGTGSQAFTIIVSEISK